MDMDALLAFARLFSQEGANLISLMSTAALPFEKLLSFVAAARLVIDDHVILLVNGPDLSLEQAIELRGAGADAAYHAVRLGEGYLTDLDPRRRVQTIENIQAAGLALMSGVEPLWRNAPEDELLDAIERQILATRMERVLQPYYCGKLLYTWPKARIALKSKASWCYHSSCCRFSHTCWRRRRRCVG